MNKKNQDFKGRRSILTGMGVAAAGLAVGATTASAQGASTGFKPARHKQDAWLDKMSGDHRVFIDSATALGGAEALPYAMNLFNAQAGAYDGAPEDFAMVVCFRHFSTPFGYNDGAWEKYGEGFNRFMNFPDPETGEPPKINLMNVPGRPTMPNQGVTIDAVKAKGTQIAICDHATHVFSGFLDSWGFGSAGEIYEELVASAVPDSIFVSAGVMATTRAQEYGYSLLYAG
jgi:hypothetical protein